MGFSRNSRDAFLFALRDVRVLSLIYALLLLITALFSRTFFLNIIKGNFSPSAAQAAVFLTIPAILLFFFLIYVSGLIRDMVLKREGGRVQFRLASLFAVTVLLTAAPLLLISLRLFYDTTRYWKQINAEAALEEAEDFILENYELKLDRFAEIQRNTDFEKVMARFAGNTDPKAALSSPDFPGGGAVTAIQEFERLDKTWVSRRFVGDEKKKLENAVSETAAGFLGREMPRDQNVVRFADSGKDFIRVVTYSLGEGFDDKRLRIANAKNTYAGTDASVNRVRSLLIFCYSVFFIPSLLITLIIAITYTRGLTQPVLDLASAARRVSEGDFSVQVAVSPDDEMAYLVTSFNAMVLRLEKTREDLVREEKKSVWQTMAQQLAHEIKNPLTPIKLSAERVLRMWRNDPERLQTILENSMLAIIQEVESLSALLNEFRILSRPIEPSKTEINVREAVESALAPYRASHPGVVFDTSGVDGFATVLMDERHFEQVLANLVINAIDAMDGRGSITIRSSTIVKQDLHYHRITVSDTGKGISADDVSRIFTPYFTTKESGTGLGLPIVERIINDYGGSILVNSSVGAGATFIIDLRV